MTVLKIVISILAGVNTYIGSWFLLNAFNILQTSKYSKTATIVFAFIFLAMGVLGIYFLFHKNNMKAALWISIGPWILALLFMFIVMLTSDYK